MFYGMPIHIIRDVALTIRSFYKRINDFVRYRQATKDMNARYPDATAAEVAREDVCIICREDMRPWRQPPEQAGQPAGAAAANAATPSPVDERLRPKKLPCGHILHFTCLRSWLERQQNCPTCRTTVLIPNALGRPQGANPRTQGTRARTNPEQPQGPGAVHGEAQQPVMPQNVFQFGPFRLAFGARHAGQGFAQQGDVQRPQHNQHAPVPVNGDLQRLGNAFGFLRQAPADQRTTANLSVMNVPLQLHHIEQQLMREINGLRVQADQLVLVRALQGELARLRIAQTNPGASTSTGAVTINHHRPPNSMVQGAQPFPTTQIFSSNQQQQAMRSGHRDLPPGVTVPDGWTVLPLQRLANGANLVGSTADLAHTFHPSPQANIDDDIPPPTAARLADPHSAQPSLEPHSLQTSNGLGDEGSANLSSASSHGNASELSRERVPPAPRTSNGTGRLVGAQAAYSNSHERSQMTPPLAPSNPEGLSEDGQPHILSVWDSASKRFSDGKESAQNDDGGTSGSASGELPSHGAAQYLTPAAENSHAKGKGKAATVEDEVDDAK